ncbi:MAG: lytic murein transglycosylase [Pseudomonadota bacterium]
MALTLLLVAAQAAADDFQACLTDLQVQARQQGLAPAITEQLIPGLTEQRRVVELDRQQPEFVQTFERYLSTRVTEQRVARGRALYEENREFLDELTVSYGIPGHYLVAFWGLETNFGSYLGKVPILDALATLACDQRRSGFFTTEFLTALTLVERDGLDPETMRGSWAGAMGHTQFMPSTYARAAIDGDGDQRIDLWGSHRDALASGARFLAQLGWQRGLRWGREVRLPQAFPYQRAGLDQAATLRDWANAGLRRADGAALPVADIDAALLVPAGHQGPAFLVYQNFEVIMGWNRSEFYALSVGYLADRIAGAGTLLQPPSNQTALTRDDLAQMQAQLNQVIGSQLETDGIMGPATRRVLSQFQEQTGRIADGFPDAESLAVLRNVATTPEGNR